MASHSSSTPTPPSLLAPAVLTYLTLIYAHLSGWTLAQAVDKHFIRADLHSVPSDLTESVATTICQLELLLWWTNAIVSGVRRVNLVIEIVLWNYMVHTEDEARRVEDEVGVQSAQVNHAKIKEARQDGL